MARSIQIFIPASDLEWTRQALELLAASVISDEEAGQRGAKLSIFIRMIASAYIGNGGATEAVMQEVKRIALGRPAADAGKE